MNSRVELNEEIAKELDTQEKLEKGKKIFKILATIFIPLFIIFTISFISLRYIGNIGIIVKEYPIINSLLPTEFHGKKIVQFSDLHYNKYTDKNKIKKLVNIINKTNPDIIIFTGDLIDLNYNLDVTTKEFLIKEFKKINAHIGKYAIKGEEDSEYFNEILINSNFKILENTIEKVYINKNYIQLIAINDNYQTLQNIKEQKTNNYSIAITHTPDKSDDIISNLNTNLILAGHSHNGQVRFPFIGALMKRENSKKYIDSYYKINNTELLISGGLGNTKYNMRLFNHPSINFIRLRQN